MDRVPISQWVMRGLLLFVLAFTNLNDIWSPDVIPNALLPFTLVREGNVDYDEFVFRPNVTELREVAGANHIDSEAYFFRACGVSTATAPPKAPRSKGGPPAPGPNDHVCSVFPPGMGLLALPFFLPSILSGAQALDLGLLLRVGHVAAAFYETLAALLLWSVLRRIASARASFALILLYYLGTSVRTVASQALWQHPGAHLAVALALWLTVDERPRTLAREFVAGLVLGLGSVVRQTTALVSLGLAPSRGGWRPVAALGAGAVLGVLPLLIFNWIAYGSPIEQGYGVKPFDTPVFDGLVGLLFSPSRGLFVYEPWAVLALVSMVIARFANLVVYATYAEWWGGRVFGPRFLDDLAPVLVAGLAWGVRGGWFAFGPMKTLLWLSSAWSLLIFNAAAFVYDQKWDTVPINVNDDPSRLFSWSDPQWLAVLREVPNGGARVVAAVVLTLLALAFLARVEGLLGSNKQGRVIASSVP
jgi:hypothetical protein